MFISMEKLLQKHIQKSGLESQLENSFLLDVSKKELQKKLNSKIMEQAHLLYIKNEVLVIAVLNSMVIQEFRFQEKKLVSSINGRVGKTVIRRFHYLT